MGFFDDLSKKASATYKNTAEKTNKLTREMKLKSLINDDKAKIEKIYSEIGKKVYEKHIREENIDIKVDLLEECSKIDAYSKEIEDMRVEMLALKDLRICKQCATEIPVNAKFCPKCGAVQEELQFNQPGVQVQPTQQPVAQEPMPAQPVQQPVPQAPAQPVQQPEPQGPAPAQPVEANNTQENN